MAGVSTRARFYSAGRYALLAIVLGLVVVIRLRLLDLPLERDEGEHAYAGQLLRHGIPPYQLAYNMKFPGVYAAYALLLSIFRETTVGVHAGLLLVNMVTVGFIFLLGRRLLDARVGGAAAAVYALLSVSPSAQGFAAHATHFVVLPVLAGTWLLLVKSGPPGRWRIFVSGLCFGLALLMKQPGAAFVPLGFLLVVWKSEDANDFWRLRLIRGAVYLGATLLPFALTCLLLWRAGVFGKFWFWTFQYAREYATQLSLAEAARNFGAGFAHVVGSGWLLWLFALGGLVLCLCQFQSRPHRILLGLLGCGFLAVFPGFYFRPHYFILVLPAIALLAGVAAVRAADRRPWFFVVFALALGWPLIAERDFFFRLAPAAASRHVYGTNPFPESLRVANFLRENTSPNDTIVVLGSEPQIYFYAGRKSGTGYIYVYGLMEGHRYSAQMQEEMIQEIVAARPKYIIFVSVAASWLRQPDSPRLLADWFEHYSAEALEPAGYVGILGLDRTEYHLPHGSEPLTPTDSFLAIWKRRL